MACLERSQARILREAISAPCASAARLAQTTYGSNALLPACAEQPQLTPAIIPQQLDQIAALAPNSAPQCGFLCSACCASTACARICMHRKKINIASALAGQKLGIKEVDDGIWPVSFMKYDLGYVDLEQKRCKP